MLQTQVTTSFAGFCLRARSRHTPGVALQAFKKVQPPMLSFHAQRALVLTPLAMFMLLTTATVSAKLPPMAWLRRWPALARVVSGNLQLIQLGMFTLVLQEPCKKYQPMEQFSNYDAS